MEPAQQFDTWKTRVLTGHPEVIEAVAREIDQQIQRMGSEVENRPNGKQLAELSLAADIQSERATQSMPSLVLAPTMTIFYNSAFNSIRADVIAENLNRMERGETVTSILSSLNPLVCAVELLVLADKLVHFRIGSNPQDEREKGFISTIISEASEARLSAAVEPYCTTLDDDARLWAEQFKLTLKFDVMDG